MCLVKHEKDVWGSRGIDPRVSGFGTSYMRVPIGKEESWDTEIVWFIWRGHKYCSDRELNCDPSAVQPTDGR
jgi:hypothetical protein